MSFVMNAQNDVLFFSKFLQIMSASLAYFDNVEPLGNKAFAFLDFVIFCKKIALPCYFQYCIYDMCYRIILFKTFSKEN